MSWVICRFRDMAAYSNALLGDNHSQLHCSLIQSSSCPYIYPYGVSWERRKQPMVAESFQAGLDAFAKDPIS